MDDRIVLLKEAKDVFDRLGADPQKIHTVLSITKSVDNDPQKLFALLAIARFLSEAD